MADKSLKDSLKKLKKFHGLITFAKIIPLIAIIVLIIVIISAGKEAINKIAATKFSPKSINNSSSVDNEFSPQAYYNSIYITENGTIMAGLSVQDMWDNVFKEMNSYVTDVNELAYWLNAQIVTQYPYIEGADKNALNGTVKFYRNKNSEPLQYVSKDTLDGYVSSYNSNGDKDSKDKALSSFCLNKDGTITVAYLEENTYTATTKDPAAAKEASEKIGAGITGKYKVTRTESNLQTTTISYQNYIQPYTLPFSLLWTIACIGEDGSDAKVNANDFVHALASMAYDSEIHLLIDDNTQKSTTTNVYTYNIQTTKSYTAKSGKKSQKFNNAKITVSKKVKVTYKETNIISNPSIKLKHIKSWCAKYDSDAEYSKTDSGKQDGGTTDLEDEKGYYGSDKYTKSATVKEVGDPNVKRWMGEADITDPNAQVNVEGVNKYKRINIKEKSTTQTISSGFSDGSATSPQFNDEVVELFRVSVYDKVKNYVSKDLYSDYFLPALEENCDETSNTVDMIKYIFNKVWDTNEYGVTDFPFQEYNDSEFSDFAIPEGNSFEEKLWFGIRSLGHSEASTAGALGNFQAEGGMHACIKEKSTPNSPASKKYADDVYSGKISRHQFANDGIGYGLIGWTYHTLKEDLYDEAKRSNSRIDDENVQLRVVLKYLKSSKNYNWVTPDGTNWYPRWKNASNPKDAASCFMHGFERPRADVAHEDRRRNYAQKFYDKYKGKQPSSSNSSEISSSSSKYINASKDEKMKYLFPNGVPTTPSQIQKYLTTIQVPITTKSGKKTTTSLRIHKLVADDVKKVFQTAQDSGFKIYSAKGYSFRKMNNGGSGEQSYHSYGIAIDINVAENYSRRGKTIYAGKFWDPSKSEYSIPKDGVLVKAFNQIGWKWGGNWPGNYQDYMHFSFTGN